MASRPSKWGMWTKIAVVGLAVSIGGPLFTGWVTPSQEELRAKYNPDLRSRAEAQGREKEEEFDQFVTKLKEYSKSDKSIWIAMKEEEERRRVVGERKARQQLSDADVRREQMRKEVGLGSK